MLWSDGCVRQTSLKRHENREIFYIITLNRKSIKNAPTAKCFGVPLFFLLFNEHVKKKCTRWCTVHVHWRNWNIFCCRLQWTRTFETEVFRMCGFFSSGSCARFVSTEKHKGNKNRPVPSCMADSPLKIPQTPSDFTMHTNCLHSHLVLILVVVRSHAEENSVRASAPSERHLRPIISSSAGQSVSLFNLLISVYRALSGLIKISPLVEMVL